MPSAENCTACRISSQNSTKVHEMRQHFILQRHRITVSQKLYQSFSSSLLLGDSLFIISDQVSFVKNFFQDFQSVPGVFATFSDRRSSEAAYLVYQTGTRLSRTFFISFFNQTFRPAALADSLIIIRSPSPFVNYFFFFFRPFPPYPYPSFEPCRFT